MALDVQITGVTRDAVPSGGHLWRPGRGIDDEIVVALRRNSEGRLRVCRRPPMQIVLDGLSVIAPGGRKCAAGTQSDLTGGKYIYQVMNQGEVPHSGGRLVAVRSG